jgi:MFS family permease
VINQTSKKIGLHLFLINAFVFIPTAQYTPFLSAYYAKTGITALEIGILLTIGRHHWLFYYGHLRTVYISKNVKRENQSKGQSILTIIQAGLASITGNIVGGFLVDKLGLKTSYLIMATTVITIAGSITLLQYLYEKKHNSFTTD